MDISFLNTHISIWGISIKMAMDATTWEHLPILNIAIAALNVHQNISQILHPNVHGKTHKCFYRFMSQFAPTEFGQCLEGMNF